MAEVERMGVSDPPSVPEVDNEELRVGRSKKKPAKVSALLSTYRDIKVKDPFKNENAAKVRHTK